jgi:hypothetical protein
VEILEDETWDGFVEFAWKYCLGRRSIGRVFNYVWLPLQIVLLLLASWGLLGAELGVERLFWSEDAGVQFGCGAAVGMLYGVVLFVWYLLDRPHRAVRWASRGSWPTLFPSSDPAIRAVGAYLWWAMPLLLVLLVVGKMVVMWLQLEKDDWSNWHVQLAARHYLVWGSAGYLSTIVLGWLLFVIDERLGLRQGIAQWGAFRRFGGLGRGRVPPDDISLHATSLYLVVVGCLFLGVALGLLTWLNETQPGKVITSPVLLVCLVLILLTLLYGFWSFHIHLASLTLTILVLSLLLWNSATLFPEVDYKLHIPGLEEYYEPGHRVALESLTNGWAAQAAEQLPRPLPRDADVLEAIRQRWEKQHGAGSKPPLVLVAVSGGGIRAAVWTARVLEGIEQRLTNTDAAFRDQLRLITGASGGMVAAALYVADYERNWPDRGQPLPTNHDEKLGLGLYSGIVAEQSLLPIFQTAILRDFSRTLLVPPWASVNYDRGRTLEEKWMLNARARGFGPAGQRWSELEQLRRHHRLSPFQRTFADLYELEAQGRRPSLVFAPMLTEDSRRLLISNLDLQGVAVAQGTAIISNPTGEPTASDYSRSGVECFKLFPRAWERLQLGTAARLNATFPVISPAVALPTVPSRHVVDAGYFDNYGVDLIGMWLMQNRHTLLRCSCGVALIEIRAFPWQQRGLDVGRDAPLHPEAIGVLSDMFATFSTPMQAILRARSNVGYYRNNQLLSLLEQLFADSDGQCRFLRRFIFELNTQAALSWYISDEEKRRIAKYWNNPTIQQQLESLAQWFSSKVRR